VLERPNTSPFVCFGAELLRRERLSFVCFQRLSAGAGECYSFDTTDQRQNNWPAAFPFKGMTPEPWVVTALRLRKVGCGRRAGLKSVVDVRLTDLNRKAHLSDNRQAGVIRQPARAIQTEAKRFHCGSAAEDKP